MLDEWPDRFPGCEPVAHRLRRAFPDRWVRFHSLPGSKRYPDDEGEYRTVMHRHNAVMADLAGPGAAVVLITAAYSDEPRSAGLRAADPGAVSWRAVADDGRVLRLFAGARQWRPGALDAVVRLVADEAAADVLVVGPSCRWVLHPYDGGMDVIHDSPAARDRLRARHADWLSPRPDGL